MDRRHRVSGVKARSAGVLACGFGRRLAARPARNEELRTGTVLELAAGDGGATPHRAHGFVSQFSRSAGVLACGFGRRLAARPARSEELRTGTVLAPAAGDGRATLRRAHDSLSFMAPFLPRRFGPECLPGKHSRTFLIIFLRIVPQAEGFPRRGEGGEDRPEGPII